MAITSDNTTSKIAALDGLNGLFGDILDKIGQATFNGSWAVSITREEGETGLPKDIMIEFTANEQNAI
jgi:hypothetical protein